jgi:3-hydroxyisobutyrate dehydrogenase
MTNKTLGFIGLGMMGGPMAINLLKAGYTLHVLDTNADALARVVEQGGIAAKSPAEIASTVETVLVSLPTPDVVELVALGPCGLSDGKTIKNLVDLSTTGPVMAKDIGMRLNDKGIAMLDAPVSGGKRGATEGTLAVMASGPKDLFEAVHPALETIGKKLFYIGAEPGMANIVKVGNNYMSAASSLSASEALVMGVKSGLDAKVMLDVINVSSGRNNSTETKFPDYVLPRNFVSMRARLLVKDLTLCTQTGEALGVPMWVANTVRNFLTLAVSQGHGDEPSIGLIRLIEEWAGVEVKESGKTLPKITPSTGDVGKIGFVGVGDMGGPMCHRIVDAGFDVTVYDVREEAMAPFVAKGATAAKSPKDVADQAPSVYVCLPMPEVVEAVALGQDGLIHGSAIKTYVDLSTTGSVMARKVAKALDAAGITPFDSPVSGGVTGAEAGTLALMMSGKKEVAERLAPVFGAIGKNPFYLGDTAGLGQTMKIANNYLSATANIAAAEALVMGVKAGVDPKIMLDVINASSGRSSATEERYPASVLTRDFSKGFKQRLLHKDVRLCMEEAAAQGVPMWLGSMVLQFLNYAVSQGSGDEISIALIKHVEKWAGVQVGG